MKNRILMAIAVVLLILVCAWKFFTDRRHESAPARSGQLPISLQSKPEVVNRAVDVSGVKALGPVDASDGSKNVEEAFGKLLNEMREAENRNVLKTSFAEINEGVFKRQLVIQRPYTFEKGKSDRFMIFMDDMMKAFPSVPQDDLQNEVHSMVNFTKEYKIVSLQYSFDSAKGSWREMIQSYDTSKVIAVDKGGVEFYQGETDMPQLERATQADLRRRYDYLFEPYKDDIKK